MAVDVVEKIKVRRGTVEAMVNVMCLQERKPIMKQDGYVSFYTATGALAMFPQNPVAQDEVIIIGNKEERRNFFPLSYSLLSNHFFKLSNPSTKRLNAPSVFSAGVA